MITTNRPTDASTFYRLLWLCYDAGQADARGDALLPLQPGDLAIVDVVRADWRCRMDACAGATEAARPGWLEAVIEATTDMIEREV